MTFPLHTACLHNETLTCQEKKCRDSGKQEKLCAVTAAAPHTALRMQHSSVRPGAADIPQMGQE